MTKRLFIQACHREPVDRIPVWMMRQAGRYQPEYLALKERAGGFWGLSTNGDHIAEATLFAQRSLNADAAIIFSDITIPGWAMGVPLEFAPGPKFAHAIQDDVSIDALTPYDPHIKCDFLMDGIRKTRAGLKDDISLIGFVGAPVTVAGYMIEGYPSKNWLALKNMVYNHPQRFHKLLDKLSDVLCAHAVAQVEAGCDAIQLFDTTAGELSSQGLNEFAFFYAAKVIKGLKKLNVPIIYFARNIGSQLENAAHTGADVLGVDWTVSMTDARKRLGHDIALMGNLDPTILFCERHVVQKGVESILEEAATDKGFIFNLGHGILPKTPVDNAKQLINSVHEWKI